MTSSDRPTPNAAYEPYGSPNAQSAGRATSRASRGADAVRERCGVSSERRQVEDPYAGDEHTERRNPTTALRATGGASVVERAGLDPNDQRVRALADIVDGLHQLPRHRSIHVGGFVLTREPLRDGRARSSPRRCPAAR